MKEVSLGGLKISEKRFEELLRRFEQIVGRWLHKTLGKFPLTTKYSKELVSLAKSKEEAYIIGVYAGIIEIVFRILKPLHSIMVDVETLGQWLYKCYEKTESKPIQLDDELLRLLHESHKTKKSCEISDILQDEHRRLEAILERYRGVR